jgi:hypothetical protein
LAALKLRLQVTRLFFVCVAKHFKRDWLGKTRAGIEDIGIDEVP